jgi:hypothetical protein
MLKKAFACFIAVTPAGARRTLYRDELGIVPSKVQTEKDYTGDSSDVVTYIMGLIEECTFLPVDAGLLPNELLNPLIEPVFEQAGVGYRNSVKVSIHEVPPSEGGSNNRTMLKVVTGIEGQKTTTWFDITPTEEPETPEEPEDPEGGGN